MTLLFNTLREEFDAKLKNGPVFLRRHIHFEPLPNKISVFIGMRRTGKTTYVFQCIQSLLAQQVLSSQILYVNFEDDRLLSQDHSLMVELIDSFYSTHPENHLQRCYLFFDEIQNVPNWPLVIRRLFDSKNVQICLTGSSAKLLSKEIASSLRGRAYAKEIWPFDFQEYLEANKTPLAPIPWGKMQFDVASQALQQYLQYGGFPEVVYYRHDVQNRILQEYVNLVVMRDIVERYKISNISFIKYFIKTLMRNVGSPFSLHKFFNDAKSQGFSLAKSTVYEYLTYLEDAYLLFTVPLFSESLRKVQTNPKKIYAIDPGLVNAYTFSLLKNSGHLFENIVFLDLKRKEHEMFYYVTKEGFEIDFLTRDQNGNMHLWQVAWDVENEATLLRETRALESAKKELGIEGTLITPEWYLTHPSITPPSAPSDLQ